MKSILILVSKAIIPSYLSAIDGYTNIILIHTAKSKESEILLKDSLLRFNDNVKISSILIEEENYSNLCDTCTNIYKNFNEGVLDVNLTGGTKLMTLAFYTTSLNFDYINPFYLNQHKDLYFFKSNKYLKISEKISIEEFAFLSGRYEIKNNATSSSKDLSKCELILDFILKNKNLYFEIRNYFKKSKKKNYKFPSSGEENISITNTGNLTLQWKKDIVYIFSKNNDFLFLEMENAYDVFFNDKWFEYLTLNYISDEIKSKYSIYCGLTFIQSDTKKDLSEIDILINNNYRICFVECKSGQVDQGDAAKLNENIKLFGGAHSGGILVTLEKNVLIPTVLEKLNKARIVTCSLIENNKIDKINFKKNIKEAIENILSSNVL
jgi:hypothetical protein